MANIDIAPSGPVLSDAAVLQQHVSSDNGAAKKVTVNTVVEEAHADSDDEWEKEGYENEREQGPGEEEEFIIPDGEEEVDFNHLRLQSIHLRRINWHENIKKLCLRQNQITILEPEVFKLLPNLQDLDLYDNKIKEIGDSLSDQRELTSLDLSYNLLRKIPDGLRHLTSLKTVYFIQNRISKIEGLSSFSSTLRSLELGGNKLRKIENIESLTSLEELWLGKNKISKLEGLGTLTRLKTLSIQSNRITKLEGLENLTALEEFYISHNGIEMLEGLDNNLSLRVLDIGTNFIPQLENISHLTKLEEVWANNNRIPDFTQLEGQLRHLSTLETLYLEGNPCQKNDMTGYRRKIMLALPQLKQIDATYVKQF
ncbi:L domain-like protein [Rickenella mellea]|uniref:L domain-like protein n=1 Tax=Rickenella mellea TaxID=50990 RepID=A0A4Y7QF73_9AGAM|nr:L domain-like protein [Rickenella mellea]